MSSDSLEELKSTSLKIQPKIMVKGLLDVERESSIIVPIDWSYTEELVAQTYGWFKRWKEKYHQNQLHQSLRHTSPPHASPLYSSPLQANQYCNIWQGFMACQDCNCRRSLNLLNFHVGGLNWDDYQ